MKNNYLNKVLDQIVSETKIDHDEESFLPPFFNYFTHNSVALFSSPFSPYPSFIIHCREVYGLNKSEVDYVWKEYREIIKDKIENNGL